MGRGQDHGAVYAHALLFRAGGINSGMFLTPAHPGATADAHKAAPYHEQGSICEHTTNHEFLT